MIVFHFTKKAEKELLCLDDSVRHRILEVLGKMKDESVLHIHSKKLANLLPATHRLRIDTYRLLYQRTDDEVLILKVGHRKEIYR